MPVDYTGSFFVATLQLCTVKKSERFTFTVLMLQIPKWPLQQNCFVYIYGQECLNIMILIYIYSRPQYSLFLCASIYLVFSTQFLSELTLSTHSQACKADATRDRQSQIRIQRITPPPADTHIQNAAESLFARNDFNTTCAKRFVKTLFFYIKWWT